MEAPGAEHVVPVRVVTRGGRVVSIPSGCGSLSRPYDLLIHFHGAPTAVEPAFERAELDAVLVITNLGIGSGPYEDAFAAKGSFQDFLKRVNSVVTGLCPGKNPRIGRIAVSSWSAGYGAVWRILEREANSDAIDAVLLADGLHAGFTGTGSGRQVNDLQMAPFSMFLERAKAGQKLMAITHSSIPTAHYASTTQTANFLLDSSEVRRNQVRVEGPMRDMWMTSRADYGSLHIQGYAGQDKTAHCDQLFAIGETLFPLLAERWRR
jgi:hypothetical protein